MREANGFEEIMNAINNLEKAHDLHIKHYGLGNELRLTGIHETSSIDKFSYGVGSRDTSIKFQTILKIIIVDILKIEDHHHYLILM